jgi:hypothetical protein
MRPSPAIGEGREAYVPVDACGTDYDLREASMLIGPAPK